MTFWTEDRGWLIDVFSYNNLLKYCGRTDSSSNRIRNTDLECCVVLLDEPIKLASVDIVNVANPSAQTWEKMRTCQDYINKASRELNLPA